MSRSKAGALLGLLTLAATFSAAALCGLVLCGGHAAPAACHSSQSASTRLTDCCAAHSSGATQQAMALDALSLVRVATLIATPDLVQPASAPPPPIERAFVGSAPVSLFTLHQSLLL